MPRTSLPFIVAGFLTTLSTLPFASHAFAQASATRHPVPPPAVSIVQSEYGFGYHATDLVLTQIEEEFATELAAASVASAPTEVYSHGNPSADEQYVLELINRARANPAAEGVMLASINDPAILFAYQNFNVDTAKLRTDFAGYAAKPPLAFNPKLLTSARLHSQDMSDNNFQSHDGSNGSTFDGRITAQGYTGWTALGENVFAYAQSLLYAHVGFNVDWGNSDLGHRDNIMNFKSALLTEIGIGIVRDNRPAPHVGPILITENFGNARSRYLVGVVYDDKNSNNFYDVGEGIPNVTVTPSIGQYYAVTSASGGYAIPMTVSGSVTVTASGAGLGSDVAKTVTVGTNNVKVDFLKGAVSLPGIVSLVLPQTGPLPVAVATGARFNWRAVAAATAYEFQVSSDSTFATGMLASKEVTDTTTEASGYVDGTMYYWHVRARNNAGWGPYSERRSFRALYPLGTVTLMAPENGATIGTTTRFTWHRRSVTESSYGIEVATDSAFTSIIARDTAVSDTTTMISSLPNGQQLYWRVRGKNDLGWGPYSETWRASTAVSSVKESVAGAGFRLAGIAPNPVTGMARIEFMLATTQSVELLVTDYLGHQVTTPVRGTFEAGAHVVTWNAAGLPNGVYYCTLRGGDHSQTMRFVLMR